ncbi:MAG: hypothetical protein ABFD52_02055 [Acidobacteriota bacterium]
MRRSRHAGTVAAAASAGAALVLLSIRAVAAVPAPDHRLPQRPPQKIETAPPASAELASLLAKAAGYCRRLESSAFDLACREEIRETIDPKLDRSPAAPPSGSGTSPFLGPTLTISTVRKIKRSFVYDYRCVRAGRAFREVRAQLEENGKSKVVPDAELQISVDVFGSALLGPVGLFGERVQPGFDFSIAGRDRIGSVDAVVIEAKPRPGVPAGRCLHGQAWVDPATGDILRIEWSESRAGRFDVFVRRGELFKRTPRLTFRAELGVEQNGLRFPGRLSVEEAYLKDSGKPFVRSTTEAVYKDFKFSAVTFDVRD